MKKRIISLLLAAIMVLPLAACANETDTQGSETTAPTQTTLANSNETTAPAEETEPEITPNLPDVGDKYKGTTLSIAHRGRDVTHYKERWMQADAITGDTINDAVFKRNSYIEEKYGITFEHLIYDDVKGAVDLASNSQDDIYDIALPEISDTSSLILEGKLYDFNELTYINFDQVWWDSNCYEATTYNGKTYIAVGDLSLSSQGSCRGILFNRDMIRLYGLDDPYELVKNNQWTLSKMAEMVAAVSDNLDGDDQWTDADRYGMLTESSNVDYFLISCGIQVVDVNADGDINLTLFSERTMNVIELCRSFLLDKTTTRNYNELTPDGDKYLYGRQLFSADHFLFTQGSANRFDEFAANNMESEYGILPNPKYDSEQESYYHLSDRLTSCLVVPATNQTDDLERLSIILEDMSYISSKTILPDYYETLIALRRGRVPEVGQMADIIKNTIYYDINFIYSIDYTDAIRTIFNNGNYSSTATRYQRILENNIKAIVKKLDALG